MLILSEAFKLLTCIGGWEPMHWKSKIAKGAYRIYTCLIFMLLIFLLTTQICAVFFLTKSVDDFTEATYMMCSTINVVTKFTTMLWQKSQVIDLINILSSNPCIARNNNEKKIMVHFNEISRYSVIVLIFLAEACCGVIGLRPIIFEKEEFTLPLPAWYPFNIKSGIQYWLTFLQQETALVIGSALSVAIDTIVTGFMGNICAQLQLLSARLQELSWTTSRAKKQDTSKDTIRVLEKHIVVQSVKHHQLIFRSADDINAIFAPVIPVQYCLSSAMFCMTVYQLTSNKTSVIQIVYLTLYLSAVLNEFLLFCWFGNEVTLTSLEFVSTIGGLDWTTMHIKTVKELLIIMLRSSSPITITGGPLITLSLQSFKAILKMSYSAFNILQQSN